ncbi:uncharacterized protein MYCFIDRAFT_89220 [Pseudocercospora fijiensis CIRAD86]|uniref:Uncharacterized protein n=1 Tax=Pseudocercospora fijiensis (strain CIRAD86) TaxID=383855 RepID=N1Q7D0_PSEFD|nr:uncharacterized protein MYCFIDRAFT_89220 [Pseudocercospora fijiensis CIRAD86]EME88555.1 hypothetical protein MYCFIDRAFT_89220 [Pseudocercospora fijiensis CIRAD86]
MLSPDVENSNNTPDASQRPQSPRGTKFAFGGLPYKPSMTIDSTILTTKPHSTSSSSSSSSPSSSEEVIYTPSIYTPQTPHLLPPEISPLGWDEDHHEDHPAPEPLRIRKKRRVGKGSFDEMMVPKPSDDELERPWGGRRRFMLSHGLKYDDEKDCDLRKQILEQIRELEWQNRINAAREEFFRDLEKVRRFGSLG